MGLPGQYLREQREARAISLKEISGDTKITISILTSLEADDYDSLPPPTFVKGFIRSYCKYIGVEDNDAVLRYEEYLMRKDREKASEKRDEKKDEGGRGSYNKRLMTIAGIVALIVIIGFIFYFSSGSSKQTEEVKVEGKQSESIKEESGAVEALKEGVPEVEKDGSGKVYIKKEGVLVLTARQTTWMKVEIDGGEPFEVILNEGESVRWKAKEVFSILIGNAGGVDAVLNGKKLDRLGDEGKVKRVILGVPNEE